MLFYRATLPLSAQTLSYVAGVIRRHRAAIGSAWRRLNPAGRPCCQGRTAPRSSLRGAARAADSDGAARLPPGLSWPLTPVGWREGKNRGHRTRGSSRHGIRTGGWGGWTGRWRWLDWGVEVAGLGGGVVGLGADRPCALGSAGCGGVACAVSMVASSSTSQQELARPDGEDARCLTQPSL
jgi:hypothetical protein